MAKINPFYYETEGLEVHEFYSGEPVTNFENRNQKPEATNTQEVNFKVLRLQQLMKEDLEAARNSHLYQEVMDWFFGYKGDKQQNVITKMTASVWYDLRDETVFSYQAWKNIEYAIMNFNADYLQETEELDADDLDAILRTGKNNFMGFAMAVLRRTQRKAAKENKNPRSQSVISMGAVGYEDEEGNFQEYDPEDVKANFGLQFGEDAVVDALVEKILDKLSGDAEKNRFILTYMVVMYTQDRITQQDRKLFPKAFTGKKNKADHSDKFNRRELAELMVEAFPGTTVSSNERFINRFQKRVAELDMPSGLNTTWNTDRKAYKAKFHDPEQIAHNREIQARMDAVMKPGPVKTYFVDVAETA
jgi:hypothetical protein